MKVYLVGGAVRDRLLRQGLGQPEGEPERDWVVVGATPAELEADGYRPVGRDFPVFLHPKTHEEYALARTERKTAAGYHGFAFHAAPDVTLEDDLARRDLTVNALAVDAADVDGPLTPGKVIDPYGGQRDLEDRVLRHVTDAFAEDPVRILRLGRFAARFAPFGFRVADETLALCRRMVDAGEVDALVAERVWQELSRALMEPYPRAFFDVLRACGALARILPEVDALFGVPQRPDYHPEVDTGEHTLQVVQAAADLGAPLEARLGALVHDLGKGLTPRDELPRHRGHERRGVEPTRALCERLRVPKDVRALAEVITRWHMVTHRALELRPGRVVDLLDAIDAFRRPERLEPFLLACEADVRGRVAPGTPPEAVTVPDWPQGAFLRAAHAASLQVSAKPFVEQGLRGPAVGEAVRQARIEAVAAVPR